ncbi:hypothetical protein BYZ73_21965, partial [Rhodovulum viride]
MAYARISAVSGTGATRTTVTVEGTSYDIYELPADGAITVEVAGDVDYLIVGAGGASAPTSYGASGGGSGGD